MDNCLITILEELIDNLKINVNTAKGCEKTMIVTPKLPSSFNANIYEKHSFPAAKITERRMLSAIPYSEDTKRTSTMYLNKEQKIIKTCSSSRKSLNINSIKEKKLVYSCKIPTRINNNTLSVKETHKIIDKILRNFDMISNDSSQNNTLDISGKSEWKIKKTEYLLNKTYIKSQIPMTIREKHNLTPEISRNISPSLTRYSNDPYGSMRFYDETGLGDSVTNSEIATSATSERKILKPIQRKIRKKYINSMKNDSKYTNNIDHYVPKILIPSLFTEQYITQSNNRDSKLYSCNGKYPKEYTSNKIERKSKKCSTSEEISIIQNKNLMLNYETIETFDLKISDAVKKLNKFESTWLDLPEDLLFELIHEIPIISSSTSAKKIAEDEISTLELEKYATTPECDNLPDVGTYEEFVAGRLKKERMNVELANEIIQEIELPAYEDFEKELKNYDQKKLRGIECSMFKSGNIVMTKNQNKPKLKYGTIILF